MFFALEDSLNGTLAAKSARMKCISIPESDNPSLGFHIADVQLKSLNEINETENSDISVNISENTEIEVDEVFENAVSENDNINQFQTGSFNLPVFNGECIYSEAEALEELQTLREVNNLDFDINFIYQTGPVECVGKVWGANLAQGAIIDESISYIDLIVGKDDLNNQSRAKVPSEYSRTSDLGFIEANLLFDFSNFGDYITDIDYFDNLETYFFVGHQKSMIYSFDKESSEIKPLVDLSSFVGTTENWETGLLSINPIKFENNKLYFLAGYTDKEIRVSISIFSYDYGNDAIKKEKELIANTSIIRNNLKIKATINNAKAIIRIKEENNRIGEARAINSDLPFFKNQFIMPVEGIISGVYGSQRILNGKPRWPHYGIDIAAKLGTMIKSSGAGIVTMAEDDLYYTGGTIIMDHGHGISTIYSHLENVLVSVGDKINQGDIIGTVGSTGRSTGPHLDFRINWFQTRLDPMSVLK